MATANKLPDPKQLSCLNEAGFDLVPLHQWDSVGLRNRKVGKAPIGKDWRNKPAMTVNAAAAHMAAGGNIGIRLTADLLVIDDDPRNHIDSDNPVGRLAADLELDLGNTSRTVTGGGGTHHFVRLPKHVADSIASGEVRIRNSLDEYPGVEFKCLGRQVVAPGSLHPDTGEYYRLDEKTIREGTISFVDASAKFLDAVTREKSHSVETDNGTWSAERLSKALAQINQVDFRDHDKWLEMMMACNAATGGHGLEEFVAWSTSDDEYAHMSNEIMARWKSLDPGRPDGITVRTLGHILRKHGASVPMDPDEFAEVADDVQIIAGGLQLDAVEPKVRKDGVSVDSLKTALSIVAELEGLIHPALNKLTNQIEFRSDNIPWDCGTGSRVFDDRSLQLLRAFILVQYDVELSRENLAQAVETIAQMHSYHPIVDYLDGLEWDGRPRIDAALAELFGAKDTEYSRAISRLLFVAAVRRARRPGCKYDTMIVFEGIQGIGKSSALAALCPDADWFTDASIHLGPMSDVGRAAIALEGKWIYEMAELETMSRSETNKLKALSRVIQFSPVVVTENSPPWWNRRYPWLPRCGSGRLSACP